MDEKEQERKKEYEQKNKVYRGDSEGTNKSYPSLAGYSDDESENDKEEGSLSEEEKKSRNEKKKKKSQEGAQEDEEEEEGAKEKGAEAAKTMFLSGFFLNHPLIFVFVFVVLPLLMLASIVAVIIVIIQNPWAVVEELSKAIWSKIKVLKKLKFGF